MVSKSATYTWQDLSKYNTKEKLLVAIRGKVYDLTEFAHQHPGGQNVLTLAAGRDVTLRVDHYFKDTHQDPKNHWMIWVRYAFIFLGVFASYYFQFFHPLVATSLGGQIALAILLGIFCAEVGLQPLHDGSHFTVTHSPWMWELIQLSHDFINGSSHLVWAYQHVLGHHPYTNIDGADPDVTTGDPDFRRIKPFQRYYAHYIQQHIFGPLLYGLLAVKTRLQDMWILYILKSNDRIRVNPISWGDQALIWAGKAFFVWYRILLPLKYHSISQVALMFLISDLVTSYWLALFFQVSHIVKEVDWPLPDEKNQMDYDWAVLQLKTTQDYAHDSIVWTFLTGALNYQAIHHLFPQVHQYYYPQLGPIVKQVCKEFGVTFLIKDNFAQALGSHFDHLRILGRKPTVKAE